MQRPEGYWDNYFIGMARYVATASKDPSTKCGCVIVDSHRRVLSLGYNGFPTGVGDDAARYENRDVKYALVAHAEMNAICTAARVGVPLVGTTMYLTGASCSDCMKSVIQAGIVRAVWPKDNPFETGPARERWAQKVETTELMAREAGVEIVRV